MIAIGVTIKDDARPAVQRFIEGMKPAQLLPVVGRSARNTVRTYLFAYNGAHANRLGGKRTNYYTGAARATQFRVEGDVAIVSINQVGFAQRYYGGTIVPRTKKFLTIPARAEAYGKRASEFADLIVLWNRSGPYALARAGSTKIAGRAAQGGEIMFWLVKSVTQKPNPEVLPPFDEIAREANDELAAYAHRLWQRRQGIAPDAGGPS